MRGKDEFSPFYGRACRWAMLGELKPRGPEGRTLPRKGGRHVRGSEVRAPRGWAWSFYRTISGVRLCWELAADPDYWKGEVFAYVGLPQNLKDLKNLKSGSQGQDGRVPNTNRDGRTLSPGSINSFSAVLSTEGRVVGPCWEKSKPTGPVRRGETYVGTFFRGIFAA